MATWWWVAGLLCCAIHAAGLNHDYDLRDDLGTRRSRRYVLSRKKWDYGLLTWKLHTDNMNDADRFIIRTTMHRAFATWADVSGLRFLEIPLGTKVPVDLSISFLRGRHGDDMPFDGPEGIVAHAFYPTVGVLHFDSDEEWTLNQAEGINLYQTAVHEIGHLLGLEHSSDPRSVMFPKNRPFTPSFGLADDDVRGVRSLYPPRAFRSKLDVHDLKLLDSLTPQ